MNNRLVLLLLLFPAARMVAQSPARLDAIARAQADSGFSGVVLVARDTSVLLEIEGGVQDGIHDHIPWTCSRPDDRPYLAAISRFIPVP